MSRAFACLTVLLLAVLTGFAGQSPQPPPAQPVLPTCATCSGEGSVEQPCSACEGAGNVPCRGCAADPRRGTVHSLRLDTMRKRHPSTVGNAEVTKKIDEAVADVEKSTRELVGAFFGTKDRAAGRARCAAGCQDGKPMFRADASCKACGGRGSIACTRCKSLGTVPCAGCDGRRVRVAPCLECAGTGRARDARTLEGPDIALCTWCGGSEIRACVACDENGRRERTCDVCVGKGKHACTKCRGTRKVGCPSCSATGETQSFDAREKPRPCKPCGKRGTAPCETCATGEVECASCAGAGRGRLPCDLCQEKSAPCAGCWDGGTRSWITASDRLLAAGRAPLAVRFLEEALRRMEAAAKQRAAFAGDDAAVKREIERALAKKRTELEAKLAAARKQP